MTEIIGPNQRYITSDMEISAAASAKNILIPFLPGALGQGVMFTPLVREARRHLPKSRITTVTSPLVAELLENNPGVNKIYACDPAREKPEEVAEKILRDAGSQKDFFDVLIYPDENSLTLNLYRELVRRLEFQCRIGPELLNPYLGENEKFTRPFQVTSNYRAVRLLEALKEFGVTNADPKSEFFVSEAENSRAERWLDDRFGSPKDRVNLMAIHPGGGSIKSSQGNLWPFDNFLDLAKYLHDFYNGVKLFFIIDPEDKARLDWVQNQVQKNKEWLAVFEESDAKGSIRELAAVIKRCGLFIGHDGGPAHLAGAVRVASRVVLFPDRTTCDEWFYPHGNDRAIVSPTGWASDISDYEIKCAVESLFHR